MNSTKTAGNGWPVGPRLPHRSEMLRRAERLKLVLALEVGVGGPPEHWEVGSARSRIGHEFWPEGAGDVVVLVKQGTGKWRAAAGLAMGLVQLSDHWAALVGPQDDREEGEASRAGRPSHGWHRRSGKADRCAALERAASRPIARALVLRTDADTLDVVDEGEPLGEVVPVYWDREGASVRVLLRYGTTQGAAVAQLGRFLATLAAEWDDLLGIGGEDVKAKDAAEPADGGAVAA